MGKPKLTGSDVDYYLIAVPHPKRLEPHVTEVDDIIASMGMTFAEGTVFKSLIRLCQLRRGKGKPGSTRQYEAEKMVYYSNLCLEAAKNEGMDIPQEVLDAFEKIGRRAAL